MEFVDRITYFSPVLSLIKDEKIKNFCIQLLNDADDYFFYKSASATGKYHPQYAVGECGLTKHSIAVALILHEMLETNTYDFSDDEKDVMICAAIVHDIKKYGNNCAIYTNRKHPTLGEDYIKKESKKYKLSKEKWVEDLCHLVRSHMGNYGDIKPETNGEKLLHLADCLASRRYINIEFEKVELENANLINESKIIINEDFGEYVLTFGIHKGKKMKDIDKSYLEWLAYKWENKNNGASIKARKYLEQVNNGILCG